MGPRDFGIFTLILTYGQLIANLVQFQSWKGVIRYGALHNAQGRAEPLARLFGFTATLDALGIIAGCIIAIVGVPLVGPLFHWPAAEQAEAALFAVVLLLATGGTASGILRLFDRFDLVAATEGVSPLIRLVGAAAAWAAGGGVIAFLAIWGGALVAQSIVQWIAAVAIHGARLTFGPKAFRQAARENRRLWRFMILTNLSGSLSLFWMQLGTLSVGAVTGAAQAGGFRIANRLSKGIAKPAEVVTRALYPELARLVAEEDHRALRSILTRATAISTGLGVLVVVLVGFGSRTLLSLIAGKDYAFAHVFLFLFAISAAIDLAGFALEPFHVAHGRAGRVLRIRLVGAATYMVMLALLMSQWGANGAAIASIAASAVMFAQLVWSAAQILRSKTVPVVHDELA